MTTDPAVSHHPTDSLVLPTKRRFFPFKIPNYHQQLRHYISTADRDRIYVIVERVIYTIHISSKKREIVSVIPFDPKCLAAGYGWIAIGGTNHGECAFVRLCDQSVRLPCDTSARPAAVDSALPIDLEAAQRSSPWEPAETEPTNTSSREGQVPEVHVHKFGGTIVNSVTIHRLPGDEKGCTHEDVAVLSNNDKTVTIFSLTRTKILKKLTHPAAMNYAIISPDSSLLAAVGDEASAYFYSMTRDISSAVLTQNGEKLSGWTFSEPFRVGMEIGARIEDKCCFTVAFSPSNRLCAIGSQSGVISVFDVASIRDSTQGSAKDPIICYFNSSRPCCSGGAVRCMVFSPEPWDLLVWLEDRGRAGIADVRQAFARRQIIQLDRNEPVIEEVETEPIIGEAQVLGVDLDGHRSLEPRYDLDPHAFLESVEALSNEPIGEESNSPLRESLVHDLSERERFIVEILNSARWNSRFDDGQTDRNDRFDRGHRLSALNRGASSNLHSGPRARPQDSAGGVNRTHRTISPRPVILSQSSQEVRNEDADEDGSTPAPQPSITLSWTTSPGELQSATLDQPGHAMESSSSDQSGSSGSESGNGLRTRVAISRPSVNFDYSGSSITSGIPPRPRNHQRSRSAHRRPERADNNLDIPHQLRANILTAERLRRQRHLYYGEETFGREHLRERLTTQHSIPVDHTRSPRWVRNIFNESSDHNFGLGRREADPSSSAGLGFGADGRTLYIATVTGIFEYQINIMDRRTFPGITYR